MSSGKDSSPNISAQLRALAPSNDGAESRSGQHAVKERLDPFIPFITGVYGSGTEYGVSGTGTTAGVRGTGTIYGGSFTSTGGTGVIASGVTFGVYGFSNNAGSKGVEGNGRSYDFFAEGPGVDYGTTSSIRYKKNVVELTGALDNVMKLSGVSFDWDKEHGESHAIGFIGEEVGKLYPEIVVFDSSSTDPSYYVTGMDYSKMTPVLLEAIKELKIGKDKQVEELKKGIETQQEINAAQKKEIEELQQQVKQLMKQ
jgi:hypothetical protein